MSEKLKISIYKIDSEQTLDSLCEKAKIKDFSEQTLSVANKNGFQLKLFYQRKDSYPKWKGFVGGITAANQDILLVPRSGIEGFVLFLSKEMRLYAVTGGHGHFVVHDCIDGEFGLEVLSRLIKKEDKVLKSAKDKSLTGGVLGTTKYFRKNFNLFDNDSFGKIYKELKASLNKDILTDKLGFTAEDIKKDSLCVAKSSFCINKEVSFDQLLTLIEGCESILGTEEKPILINSVEKLSRKKDHALIDGLYNGLLDQLWRRYSESDYDVDFDLCHEDYDEYLTASYYVVSRGSKGNSCFGDKKFDELCNADTLFAEIKSMAKPPNDKASFVKLIKNLTIASFNEENELKTENPFIEHLLGDVPHDDKRYFFIDRAWYLIKDTFIKGLNEHCNSYIKDNYIDKLEHNWPVTMTAENDYNAQYIGSKDTVVLDRVTPQNIEACDILRWDNDHLYLYHVKSGFDNAMRDLCSQITIAAHVIQQDRKADKAFIKSLYQALKAKVGKQGYDGKIGKQTETISEEEFLKLFDKPIVYVLAVLDAKKKLRSLKKVDDFGSAIAKFSLQELSKEMGMIGANLRIEQVKRPA